MAADRYGVGLARLDEVRRHRLAGNGQGEDACSSDLHISSELVRLSLAVGLC